MREEYLTWWGRVNLDRCHRQPPHRHKNYRRRSMAPPGSARLAALSGATPPPTPASFDAMIHECLYDSFTLWSLGVVGNVINVLGLLGTDSIKKFERKLDRIWCCSRRFYKDQTYQLEKYSEICLPAHVFLTSWTAFFCHASQLLSVHLSILSHVRLLCLIFSSLLLMLFYFLFSFFSV